MKQVKPKSFPRHDDDGHLPAGTKPLPMTLTVRARRARGKHGRWLNAEPRRLSGAKGRGKR
jgi:hypothetical protein